LKFQISLAPPLLPKARKNREEKGGLEE